MTISKTCMLRPRGAESPLLHQLGAESVSFVSVQGAGVAASRNVPSPTRNGPSCAAEGALAPGASCQVRGIALALDLDAVQQLGDATQVAVAQRDGRGAQV